MSTQNLTTDIKKRSAWSIFMGVLTAVLGVFLIAYPLITATITTLLLGCVLILVGVAQFVIALHSQTIGNFVLRVLLGVLVAITGVVLAFFPFLGVAALTVTLGILLLVQAGLLTATAIELRPIEGWGWFLFDAVVSLLMGVLILARWPSSSFWAIGTIVGVSVLMSGISRIMIAAKIRSGVSSVERTVRKIA